MLATNFYLKYVLCWLMSADYQLLDNERMPPIGERAIRALASCVNYIENNMPSPLDFDRMDPRDYTSAQAPVEGHFLKFGVPAGRTIRDVAPSKSENSVHSFDSFDGLPLAWGEFKLGGGAFLRDRRLLRIPTDAALYKAGWFNDTIRPWNRQVIHQMPARVDQRR